jgi:hypothetical protein
MNIPSAEILARSLMARFQAIGGARQLKTLTIAELEDLAKDIKDDIAEYNKDDEPPF